MTEYKDNPSAERRDLNKDIKAKVEFFDNVFSEETLIAAAEALPPDQRKKRWDNIEVNPEVPDTVRSMKDVLLERFPELRINTSILKRYKTDQDSNAYRLHRDPEEFFGAPLVLVTLSGEANLEVIVDGKTESVKCTKGTTIILKDPTIEHRVTPPENESGTREFVFFGHSDKG